MTSGSRRTTPLPRNWKALRRKALRRDGGRCTEITNGVRCTSPATDVDHIVPASQGGDDSLSNLASLCSPHHDAKTQREAQAARAEYAKQRVRPDRKVHPAFRRH